MKPAFILIALIVSISAQSQDLTQIEHRLLSSFQRINYWRLASYKMGSNPDCIDSLAKADTVFCETLTNTLNQCPETFHYDFPSLCDSGLVITTSSDGQFRVYNWDNQAGGSMRYIDHVFQFQTTNGIKAATLTGTSEDNDTGWPILIRPLRTATTTYYLYFTRATISGSGRVETVTAFRIGRNTLIGPIKLFKKGNKLQDQVGLQFMDAHLGPRETKILHALKFNSLQQTIKIPYLDDLYGNPTGQYTVYRWSGSYFVSKEK